MEENVKKELETLKMMLGNWAKSYLKLAKEDGWIGCGFHAEDFYEEVAAQLVPYARRLEQAGYLTEDELSEFYAETHIIIRNVAAIIKAMEELLKNEN